MALRENICSTKTALHKKNVDDIDPGHKKTLHLIMVCPFCLPYKIRKNLMNTFFPLSASMLIMLEHPLVAEPHSKGTLAWSYRYVYQTSLLKKCLKASFF